MLGESVLHALHEYLHPLAVVRPIQPWLELSRIPRKQMLSNSPIGPATLLPSSRIASNARSLSLRITAGVRPAVYALCFPLMTCPTARPPVYVSLGALQHT